MIDDRDVLSPACTRHEQLIPKQFAARRKHYIADVRIAGEASALRFGLMEQHPLVLAADSDELLDHICRENADTAVLGRGPHHHANSHIGAPYSWPTRQALGANSCRISSATAATSTGVKACFLSRQPRN